MHAEEGITDAGALKDTSRIHSCDMACLHRYHLFFLEMHHPSTFPLLRQGQSVTCDRLRGWQTFAPRGHRPAATSPRAILSASIPATARATEHVKTVTITTTDYSVLVSSYHDLADTREEPHIDTAAHPL